MNNGCVTGILIDISNGEGSSKPLPARVLESDDCGNDLNSKALSSWPRPSITKNYRSHSASNYNGSPCLNTRLEKTLNNLECELLENETLDFVDLDRSPNVSSSDDDSVFPCKSFESKDVTLSSEELAEVFKEATVVAVKLENYVQDMNRTPRKSPNLTALLVERSTQKKMTANFSEKMQINDIIRRMEDDFEQEQKIGEESEEQKIGEESEEQKIGEESEEQKSDQKLEQTVDNKLNEQKYDEELQGQIKVQDEMVKTPAKIKNEIVPENQKQVEENGQLNLKEQLLYVEKTGSESRTSKLSAKESFRSPFQVPLARPSITYNGVSPSTVLKKGPAFSTTNASSTSFSKILHQNKHRSSMISPKSNGPLRARTGLNASKETRNGMLRLSLSSASSSPTKKTPPILKRTSSLHSASKIPVRPLLKRSNSTVSSAMITQKIDSMSITTGSGSDPRPFTRRSVGGVSPSPLRTMAVKSNITPSSPMPMRNNVDIRHARIPTPTMLSKRLLMQTTSQNIKQLEFH